MLEPDEASEVSQLRVCLDKEGMLTCPFCRTIFRPELQEPLDDRPIQEQFPNASPEAREERISGMCRKCQAEVFGQREY